MNRVQSFALSHPVLIGLVFAVCAGWGGYSAFKGGMAFAQLRASVAQFANEELGG